MYARELYLKIFLSEINALSLNIKQRYDSSPPINSTYQRYVLFFIENRTPKAYAVKQAFAEADNISDKIKKAPSGFYSATWCFVF